jgi:phage shock protein A
MTPEHEANLQAMLEQLAKLRAERNELRAENKRLNRALNTASDMVDKLSAYVKLHRA